MQDYKYKDIKEDVDKYNTYVFKNNALLHLSKSLDKYSVFDSHLISLFQLILKEKKLTEINKYFEKYQEKNNDDNYKIFEHPNVKVSKYNLFYYLLRIDLNQIDIPINDFKNLLLELQGRGVSLSKHEIMDFYNLKFQELTTECHSLDDLKISKQVEFSSKNLSINILLSNNISSPIYQTILDIYKNELSPTDFTKELQQNGILHFLIKNNRLNDFDYVMKNFKTDLNLPNQEGILPIMEVRDFNTLSYIGKNYVINWNALDSDGKSIEYHFSKKENSFPLINYIDTNKNSLGVNISKEDIYSKLLLLIESNHTKKEIESFIKTHKLTPLDFEKIKNNNNDNLNYISISKGKFKHLDLFKNQSNIVDRNKDDMGVLELLLYQNFQLSQIKESKIFVSQLIQHYKKDILWSYNLINYNLSQKANSPSLSNILNSNILDIKFYSNVFDNAKNTFYERNKDLYNTNKHKLLILIEHFIEKQPHHNKTLLDLNFDTFYCRSKSFTKLFADPIKFEFFECLLLFKDIFEKNSIWNFNEFNQKIEQNIIKDFVSIYESDLESNIVSILSKDKYNPNKISYEQFLVLPDNDFKKYIIDQINKDFFNNTINSFDPILKETMPYSHHFIDFFNEIYSDFSLKNEMNNEFFTLCEYNSYNKTIPSNNLPTKRKNKL